MRPRFSLSTQFFMPIQNFTTLLQSMAEVRNWIVQHVPTATSLVGYDLFLKLGNDHFAGLPLDLQALYRSLPHPREAIDASLQQMRQAGLLEYALGTDNAPASLVLSDRFVALLAGYQRKFESLFILRKRLRDEQLLVHCGDAELSHFAQSLYDHFYDLGWFYLHNFGAVCFLMASLVKRVARAHGYDARVESGHVEITAPDVHFSLGGKGYAKPGQIDGHAMCVINDRLILDFGLGNVRKGYRRDFPWALGCEYQPRPAENILGAIVVPSGETVTWKNDWRSPGTDEELKNYEPAVEQLFQRYVSYFG